MDITWSTESVPQLERVDAWRSSLSRQVLGIRVEAEARADFFGEYRLRKFGPAAFLRVRSQRQRIIRGINEIRHSDGAWLFVSTMIEGKGLLHHAGGVTHVPAGSVSFVDGDQPFTLEFADAFSYVSVAAMRPDMLALLPGAPRAHGLTFPAPAGPALAAFMTVLESAIDDSRIDIGDENRLYQHFIGLAAAALTPNRIRPEGSRDGAILGDIKAYLVANLGHDLPASTVARHFHLSERKLQRLFQAEGVTLTRWIRHQRLDRCARDFADPRQDGRTLTAIAIARGFSDMAYFSRSFRAAFGIAPKEFRRLRRSR